MGVVGEGAPLGRHWLVTIEKSTLSRFPFFHCSNLRGVGGASVHLIRIIWLVFGMKIVCLFGFWVRLKRSESMRTRRTRRSKGRRPSKNEENFLDGKSSVTTTS